MNQSHDGIVEIQPMNRASFISQVEVWRKRYYVEKIRYYNIVTNFKSFHLQRAAELIYDV